MFLSIEELVDQAKAYPSVAELMIAVEMEMSTVPVVTSSRSWKKTSQ